MRDRVLPEQEGPQTPCHMGRNHFGQWAGDAVRALIGLDAQKELVDPKCVGADLPAALEIIARAILRIDVDRADLTLLKERAFRAQGPLKAQQARGGDLHRLWLSGLRHGTVYRSARGFTEFGAKAALRHAQGRKAGRRRSTTVRPAPLAAPRRKPSRRCPNLGVAPLQGGEPSCPTYRGC